jgi:hypothetical protein
MVSAQPQEHDSVMELRFSRTLGVRVLLPVGLCSQRVLGLHVPARRPRQWVVVLIVWQNTLDSLAARALVA